MSSLGINKKMLGMSLMVNGKEGKLGNLLQAKKGET